MSKETAKKLIAELQTSEELRAQIAGITDPAEMVKKAVEAGYDVTLEDMLAAEKEYRTELAVKSDELTMDELEGAAGGRMWFSEYSNDGQEFFCSVCYHDEEYQRQNNEYCKYEYYCAVTNVNGIHQTNKRVQ
ncbi:MAG: Nif11-like leader peptide family RiPP precursor [Ruminiclostridium sp.]|nr:Nif11-like leader peptide family RiPP precursor [Ruminiclostridium sp.]